MYEFIRFWCAEMPSIEKTDVHPLTEFLHCHHRQRPRARNRGAQKSWRDQWMTWLPWRPGTCRVFHLAGRIPSVKHLSVRPLPIPETGRRRAPCKKDRGNNVNQTCFRSWGNGKSLPGPTWDEDIFHLQSRQLPFRLSHFGDPEVVGVHDQMGNDMMVKPHNAESQQLDSIFTSKHFNISPPRGRGIRWNGPRINDQQYYMEWNLAYWDYSTWLQCSMETIKRYSFKFWRIVGRFEVYGLHADMAISVDEGLSMS